MPRLPLLLCVLALAGSVTSAVLFLRIGDSKRVLELRLSDAQQRTAKLETDLATANEQTGVVKTRLSSAEAELAATRAQLASSDAHAKETAAALADSKTVLAVYEQTARALGEEVAALRQDLNEARDSNATPEAVAIYKGTIAELEKQLAAARNGVAVPNTAAGSTAVFTSRAGRATILTVGPDNAFVVLNFGSARGAQLGQKLTVSQGNNVVATVQISDVRANYSIAQVLPDSLRGVIAKGDSALVVR